MHIRHLRESSSTTPSARVPDHPRRRLPLPGHGGLAALLRSLTNRLALLSSAITLAAIAVVWLGVVPTLESSLRDQQLAGLARDADRHTRPIEDRIFTSADVRSLHRAVRQAADASGDRVTLLGVTRDVSRTPPTVQAYIKSDSTEATEIRDLSFAVATDAAIRGRTVRGTEAWNEGTVAEAAKPLSSAAPTGAGSSGRSSCSPPRSATSRTPSPSSRAGSSSPAPPRCCWRSRRRGSPRAG